MALLKRHCQHAGQPPIFRCSVRGRAAYARRRRVASSSEAQSLASSFALTYARRKPPGLARSEAVPVWKHHSYCVPGTLKRTPSDGRRCTDSGRKEEAV